MTYKEKYEYIESRLKDLDLPILNITIAISDDNIEKSYKLLKENPKISKEEFLSKIDMKEDDFDMSDHNLRIYKYTYCSECGQLVDKMDYKERKYCRYCENPTEETFEKIEQIYENAKFVMNYLLSINAQGNIIKLAIADRNLDKSLKIIKNNESISEEEFVNQLGI